MLPHIHEEITPKPTPLEDHCNYIVYHSSLHAEVYFMLMLTLE